MITEDYVSFEIAKLLKEKGFINPCLRVYDNKGIICIRYTGFDVPHNYLNRQLYLCPTHQMAMKWLREIHGIDISIKITNLVDKNRKYYGMIWDRDNNTYIVDLFDTYEETEEAVLKTCLENLI